MWGLVLRGLPRCPGLGFRVCEIAAGDCLWRKALWKLSKGKDEKTSICEALRGVSQGSFWGNEIVVGALLWAFNAKLTKNLEDEGGVPGVLCGHMMFPRFPLKPEDIFLKHN